MTDQLKTTAEIRADEVRELPSFNGFSLPAVRERVAELLGMIGREGVFATYTVHDIRHIDAMLRMLDWLVPPSTQQVMTPVDWLMTVLSIYLHDLGMLVTADEFHKRSGNPEYVKWFESLAQSSEGRDYVGRTSRMNLEEKERFFFQEFVRRGHAQRIREWITGRHSRLWGAQIRPIATAIEDLLKHLPVRFKDYLGTICESHHKADLDNTSIYPLLARFGNQPQETGNIQYSAVLLRTADVLHVTKDRTPSVMFQLIRFSDPKSVEEWDKQLGAFAVGPKGRKLVETDPQTAVISVNADFSEERPLFSLQEYIAYADLEIKQSRRWIEKSQEFSDGKDYSFPWHEVSGDVRLEGVPPQPLRFELDRGRLLDLLVGHTIYNDPTVAVRELLQNAIDAVRFQAYLYKKTGPKARDAASGKVQIRWDATERVLVVEDNGVGMDRDVIKHHLMSVGSSYYSTPQFEVENSEFAAISRFGIGILTCFMVSDDVEIVTLKKQKGYRIRMTSVQSTYLLRELDLADPLLSGLEPHGTRVTIRLRASVDLSKKSLEEIVRYWIVLPECPVLFVENGKAPIEIGFKSPAHALESYLLDNETDIKSFNAPRQEILATSHTVNNGVDGSRATYDLAFVVKAAPASFIPERVFSRLDGAHPAVCIEGIRVSNVLPGFESRDGLSALLSVRGSKKFRTTVSRDGLEIDEEYENVSKLSAEMLFGHVSNEIARIASRPGRPLSLASTAAKWLVNDLERAAQRKSVEAHLEALFNRQQSIVLERVESGTDRPTTTRELLSLEQLQALPFFWTIESRSVDSLGIISRDLGRELSLNDFLVALAPDITQLRYSPILPDAHDWISSIRRSFQAETVEFSRQHLQSAVKWIRCSSNEDRVFLDLGRLPMETFRQLTLLLNSTRQRVALRHEVATAVLDGDHTEVEAVVSRVGVFLKTGSMLEQIWSAIQSRLQDLIANGGSAKELFGVLVVATMIVDAFATYARKESDRVIRSRLMGQQVDQQELVRAMAEIGIAHALPPDWPKAFRAEAIFSARDSWRAWGEL